MICAYCEAPIGSAPTTLKIGNGETETFHDLLCLSGHVRRVIEKRPAIPSAVIIRTLVAGYRDADEGEAARIRERIEVELDRIGAEERAGTEGR